MFVIRHLIIYLTAIDSVESTGAVSVTDNIVLWFGLVCFLQIYVLLFYCAQCTYIIVVTCEAGI